MSARLYDVHYPKNLSYKPVVKKLLEMTGANNQPPCDATVTTPKTMPLPSKFSPHPASDCKTYRLKDGGRLTIIRHGDFEVFYYLKLTDGREVTLEKRTASMSLVVTDANGKVVKTLGYEFPPSTNK